MAKRLVKVAKELNVGTSTIVEHLISAGFEIENKPTAKITDEMESELLKEFQKSIAIKEQADQLIIGTRPVTKREAPIQEVTVTPTPVTPPPPVAPSPPPPPPPKPEPIAVEPEPVVEAPATPEPEPEPAPTPVVKEIETPKPEPEPEPEPKPVVEAIETPKPEPKKEKIVLEEKAVEEQKVEPVVEEITRAKPKVGLKIKGKIDLDNKPKRKKEKPKAKKEEKPTVAPEPVAKTKVPEPEPEKKPEKEKAAPAEQPKKESEEIPAEATNKKAAVPPTTDPDPDPVPVSDGEETQPNKLIKAAAPELRGLKILGKINIEKPKKAKKKKPEPKEQERGRRDNREGRRGPNSRTDQKGKEGERKTSGTGPDGKPTQGQGSGAQDDRPKRKRTRRRVKANTTAPNDNRAKPTSNPRPPRGGRGAAPARGRRRGDDVKEVSQKEIDDQIKATMARLSGGGKKRRQKMARDKRDRHREKQEQKEQELQTDTLQLTEFVTVQELANLMNISATQVIMTCMNLGVIVSINQRLDAEIIELVAEEFDHEVEFISVEEDTETDEILEDAPEDTLPRAPIVTVMGHVDHGKTSLLDFIREANVVDDEAGGITQHIGAYEVEVGEANKRITFLDTPGHEAFTAMRARGAKVTDIAIIIVAADDSIMPQTREAISHAQAAGVPMVFAINKIDKDGSNPERIKQELASMNILVEEWGGDFQSQDISAKTGDGIPELLEKVLLAAEFLELGANPDRKSVGTILEASLDKGRGYVAKALVQTGTLNIGDPIVAGGHSGKVKAMFNERGKRVDTAGPSTPVLVLGLSGAPQAGERFKETETEPEARQLAAKRARISREQANRATKRISLDEIGRRLALGTFKELNLIVKGDMDGSVEALSDSLIKQSIETVQVNVIHKAVGQIIESDVLLATASDAIIIGFQVRPSLGARKLAEREGVQIKTYSIIYEAIEEVRAAIEGMLEPTKEEKIVANVQVREIFKISKVGTIAGCIVQDGKITRNSHVRIIRNGIVVYPTKEGANGELASLKRFKDDVKEIKKGLECGMSIKNYNDLKVDDIIEGYEIVEVKQTLGSIK